MFAIKTFVRGTTALAVTLGALCTPATADDQDWHYVKDMVLTNSQTMEIVVKNTAANHQLSSLNLGIQGSTIAVSVGGAVDCLGTTSENALKRHGAFLSEGAFGIGRTSLVMQKALPNSNSIDHVSDIDAKLFQMPKALLANPQIDLDPVALVLAAADQAPDRLQYLRQDHVIMASLPIRWESTCTPYTRYKVKKKTLIEADATGSYLTRDVPVKIVYKGDPQLTNLNAQVANSLPSPAFQNNPIPVIQTMTFQPNLPHHVGACPATTKIRVFYQGHGKGAVQITIEDAGKIIANSGTKPFNGAQGQQFFDFEIQVPKPYASQLNKTVNHTLKAAVRRKASGHPSWDTSYETMATVVWKHRCTPQVNPALSGNTLGGNTLGGAKFDGTNGGGSAKPMLKPKRMAPVDPTRPARAPAQ